MKNKFFYVIVSLSLLSFVVIEASNWSADLAHSNIGFSIKHMGISETNGNFSDYNISMTSSKSDFSDASIEFSAKVNSVNTGNETRDKHLCEDDFFDAVKFPLFTFKSTSFQKIDAKNYRVEGVLTMRGISKPITLMALHNGTIKNRSGNSVAGFELTGSIKRLDFGVGDQESLGYLSDEVMLNADLELVQED